MQSLAASEEIRVAPAPALAPGARLVGAFEGSGYREPPHLVRRSDGQLVRLPALLYLVAQALDRHRCEIEASGADPAGTVRAVAESVREQTDLEITTDQVVFLIDHKLATLGVTTYSDGTPPAVPKADPFLALRFRVAVLPESVTWLLSGLFSWLFWPPLVALVLLALTAGETWLIVTRNLAGAIENTLLNPASILGILGLALAGYAFHEIGHAAACRYGGARPGVMGCGIYLVWPAFYTDITDSYRLARVGRIRTDLGGVYFSGLFAVGATVAYAATGFQPLLVLILTLNVEILQQLIPIVRFDGYYVVADLLGIPDLFRYVGPTLRRTLLRRAPDERLQAIKRWPQTVLTAWVIAVVVGLTAQLSFLAFQLPRLIATDWLTIRVLALSIDGPVSALASAIQILLLLLPLAGLLLIFWQLARAGIRLVRRYLSKPVAEAAASEPPAAARAEARPQNQWEWAVQMLTLLADQLAGIPQGRGGDRLANAAATEAVVRQILYAVQNGATPAEPQAGELDPTAAADLHEILEAVSSGPASQEAAEPELAAVHAGIGGASWMTRPWNQTSGPWRDQSTPAQRGSRGLVRRRAATAVSASAVPVRVSSRHAAYRPRVGRRRRGPWILSATATGIIVAVIAGMVAAKPGLGLVGAPPVASAAEAQRAAAAATSVPPATLDAVGAGGYQHQQGAAGLQPLRGAPLAAGQRPAVVYIGAEYCPFCAAERWPLVVALSRFGTFSGLRAARSSPSDVHPNTSTFSFAGSRYASPYLDFAAVELADRSGRPLQSPNAAQKQLLERYDGPPYTQQRGAIPFVYLAGKYVSVGASLDQSVIDNASLGDISSALSNPTSPIARGVDGSANAWTAALCQTTGGQPAPVCAAPGVRAAAMAGGFAGG
jgi:putative peptide zinc metalloprotease protein